MIGLKVDEGEEMLKAGMSWGTESRDVISLNKRKLFSGKHIVTVEK